MAGAGVRTRFNLNVVLFVLLLGALVPLTVVATYCPTGFANFGDSLTDTGNVENLFPYTADAENFPYGETFFGQAAKRFSNGRLVPDFFSLAFGKPLLDAYYATTSFNYRHGINLAVAGATAAPLATAVVPFSVNPYQVANFLRFKNSAQINTTSEGNPCRNFDGDLPLGEPYGEWLYTIAAGGNDVLSGLIHNMPSGEIINKTIPAAVGNVSVAIQTLYGVSARKFLLFNIPPQGCSTIILSILQNSSLPKDSMGCIIAINELVSAFNAGLNETVQALRKSLPDVTISLFDYYSANLEILEHPTTYGFDPNLTYTACCGAPGYGSLNYNPLVTCGHPSLGSNVCRNPNQYVNWDGVHFTEQFYRTISEFALSGKYTDEGVNYTADCNLDFSKFGPRETLRGAYPSQCNNLFG